MRCRLPMSDHRSWPQKNQVIQTQPRLKKELEEEREQLYSELHDNRPATPGKPSKSHKGDKRNSPAPKRAEVFAYSLPMRAPSSVSCESAAGRKTTNARQDFRRQCAAAAQGEPSISPYGH